MVFGLFKKRCPICRMTAEKDTAINRFEEYFCSEAHAEEYRQKQHAEHKTHHAGCCH